MGPAQDMRQCLRSSGDALTGAAHAAQKQCCRGAASAVRPKDAKRATRAAAHRARVQAEPARCARCTAADTRLQQRPPTARSGAQNGL